jgi:hypothetical protein
MRRRAWPASRPAESLQIDEIRSRAVNPDADEPRQGRATEENRNGSRTILATQAMMNVGGWTGVDGGNPQE